MEPLGALAIACVVGYLLGSIPFGLLASRMRGIDIRTVGSGNIGATNVYRALGWKIALVVFALDVSKGLIPAVIAKSLGLGADGALLAGIAAVFGHCLSPFLGFRGGKGIATTLGAALGSVPIIALCALGVFVLSMAATRIVSLSSLLAVPSTLLWGGIFGATRLQISVFAVLSAFIVIRHWANIGRLMKGTEPKLSIRAQREQPSDEPEVDRLAVDEDEEAPAGRGGGS